MSDAGGMLWRHDQPTVGWGHGLVSALALVLSVLLHYLVIEQLPELPVGEAPDFGNLSRTRPIALQDVRRNPEHVFERPDPFRAEDPSLAVNVSREAEAFVEAVDPVFAAPERPPEDALAGQDQATIRPVAPDDRAAWEPRQDILKIEEQRVAEDARAAPRRFTLPVSRVPDAPDIQLPVILPADLTLAQTTALSASTEALLAGSFRRPVVPNGPLLPEPAFADDGPGGSGVGHGEGVGKGSLIEEVAAIDQPEKEAAPYAPVEDVLNLTIKTFRAADETDFTYFQLEISRKDDTGLQVLGRDVLIMQDCSESMTQRKLDDCKDGIHHVLDQLNPEDRYEILSFREGTERCFNEFAPADSRARAKANFFVNAMDARGKTDVYASLEALMTMPRAPGRPFIAMLITDGRPTAGLVDSSDIIETFTRNNQGNVSVFGLGGGRRVNRFLLDLLSYRNRGDARVVEDRRDIPDALRALAAELRRPVLINLRQRFSGIADSETFPTTLTHLYLDRPLVLYGRYRGDAPRAAFQVVGDARDGRKDMVFPLEWAAARPGEDAIRTRWAWHKVYSLIGDYIETRREDVLNQMIAVADRYHLPVPYGRDIIYR